jgi:hypothetical protein
MQRGIPYSVAVAGQLKKHAVCKDHTMDGRRQLSMLQRCARTNSKQLPDPDGLVPATGWLQICAAVCNLSAAAAAAGACVLLAGLMKH